jgi:GNAT superfamily N-acetyltransferase
MTEIALRPAGQEDLDTLWDFLAMAGYEPHAAAAKAIPMLAAYLDGWQRPQDFGFIAEQDGAAIGAIWARQFEPNEDPAYYCEEQTPEVAVAVKSHARGQGSGQTLLRALMAEAAGRGFRLCLNVRSTNPALRLYERMGFQPIPGMTVPNRVGGVSIWMVWRVAS